jgi:hypothetical protein
MNLEIISVETKNVVPVPYWLVFEQKMNLKKSRGTVPSKSTFSFP